ncbi:MAG: hypothetical protein M3Y77_08305 [Actinomycetota bacterium]|nr:hypothetical protein [Actinomycetota bacterium]
MSACSINWTANACWSTSRSADRNNRRWTGCSAPVLKTYREYRAGAGAEWLNRYWPKVIRLLDHVTDGWVEPPPGLLIGVQR